MNLADYMTLKGLDDSALAALIGRDRTTVYRLRSGKTRPTWDLAAVIADVTAGAVTANDFMPTTHNREGDAA